MQDKKRCMMCDATDGCECLRQLTKEAAAKAIVERKNVAQGAPLDIESKIRMSKLLKDRYPFKKGDIIKYDCPSVPELTGKTGGVVFTDRAYMHVLVPGATVPRKHTWRSGFVQNMKLIERDGGVPEMPDNWRSPQGVIVNLRFCPETRRLELSKVLDIFFSGVS